MKIKLLLFFLAIFLFELGLYAQEPMTSLIKMPNEYIPLSPNAEGLCRYGNYNVDNYSGLVPINIPLYNIMDIPISLSYNTSGIRVVDIASWVGLGWSLNAGGCISVNVNHAPDLQVQRSSLITYDRLTSKCILDYEYLEDCHNGLFDLEPDIFSYNFCGYQGQFVLDNNMKPLSISNNEGLSIQYDTLNKNFTITDKKGRKYFFNEFEKSDVYISRCSFGYNLPSFDFIGNHMGNSINDEPIISAIYLSHIELENNGGFIYFTYTSEKSYYFTRPTGALTTANGEHGLTPTPPYEWKGETDTFTRCAVETFLKKLSSIRFDRDNSTIKFIANHKRVDLAGTNALTAIIYETEDSLERWNLEYDYLTSPTFKEESLNGVVNRLDKRLILKSLYKQSCSTGIRGGKYNFEYYGESATEDNLRMPYRTACDGFDHWDYYNGSCTPASLNEKQKLFPTLNSGVATRLICVDFSSTNGMGNSISNFQFATRELVPDVTNPPFEGGNRTPNDKYAKSFTLKSIQYPTGGKSEFIYEGNLYKYVRNNPQYVDKQGPGIRIKTILDISGVDTIRKRYEYRDGVIMEKPDYYLRGRFRVIGDWSSNGNLNGVFNYYYMPKYGSMCNGQYFDYLNFFTGGYIISTSSLDKLQSLLLPQIGYREVAEISDGIGKTVNFYTTAVEYPAIDYRTRFYHKCTTPTTAYLFDTGPVSTPVFPFRNYVYQNRGRIGKKDKVEVYNEGNELVQQKEYRYCELFCDTVYTFEIQNNTIFAQIKYSPILTDRVFLNEEKIVDYMPDRSKVLTTKKFSYNLGTELLTESIVTRGNNEVRNTFTYPFDYVNASSSSSNDPSHFIYLMMVNKNIISYPIQSKKYINGVISEGIINKYGMVNIGSSSNFKWNFLPMATYNLYNNDGVEPSNFDGVSIDEDYFYKALNFDSYDLYGNPTQWHNENNIYSSMVWDINGLALLAKIDNSLRDRVAFSSFEAGKKGLSPGVFDDDEWICRNCDVENGTGPRRKHLLVYPNVAISTVHSLPAGRYRIAAWVKVDGSSNGALSIQGAEPLWAKSNWSFQERIITVSQPAKITLTSSSGSRIAIDDLRICPEEASIETYGYDIAGRIISRTDDNGKSIYYNYDALGRLSEILNNDQIPLKEYWYHYTGQPAQPDGLSYNVNLVTNGGVLPSVQPQNFLVFGGCTIRSPLSPTRKGYNFKGWFKNASCTKAWIFSTDVAQSNVILYAKWEKQTFGISSTAGFGGSITPIGISTVQYGSSKTYTIKPNNGYDIKAVKVDGVSKGTINSYTFEYVNMGHVISAEFSVQLTAFPMSLSFPSEGGAKKVTITTVGKWTAKSNALWLTVSNSSGSGTATITINASLSSITQRTGTITVTCGGVVRTISVTQYQRPTVIDEPSIPTN